MVHLHLIEEERPCRDIHANDVIRVESKYLHVRSRVVKDDKITFVLNDDSVLEMGLDEKLFLYQSANIKQMPVKDLKKHDYVMIKGRPCMIAEMSCSK